MCVSAYGDALTVSNNNHVATSIQMSVCDGLAQTSYTACSSLTEDFLNSVDVCLSID